MLALVFCSESSANAVSLAQTNRNSSHVLKPGQVAKGTIAGGQTHSYEVELLAGQYLHVVSEQIGVDVLLKLYAPDGTLSAKMNRWDYLGTTESLSLMATISGAYRIEVQAVNAKSPPGLYTLKITELRASVAQDRTRVEAERTYDKADDLSSEGDPQSLHDAIEELQSSLKLWRQAKDKLFEATTLVYLGVDSYSAGDPTKALDYYVEALPLWRVLKDASGEAVTLSYIAGLYEALGEYEKSLLFSRQALLLARKLRDVRLEAQIIHDLGIAYQLLGESEVALRYQFEALKLAKVSGDRVWEAHILHHIGEIYSSLGVPSKALHFLNSALERSHALGDRLGEATALNHLGRVYGSQGDTSRALEQYFKALELRRKAGYRLGEAQTLLNVGGVYDSLNQAANALSYFNDALHVSRAIAALPEEASSLYGVARAERGLDHLPEALTSIQLALEITQSQRKKVHSEELRASYFGTIRETYDFYIDLLMEMHRRDPTEQFAVKAFEASELARARTLLEMLNESHAAVAEGVDPILLDREHSLQQLIDGKREIQISLLGGNHTEEQAAPLKNELDELLLQYRELEGEIRAKNPRYAALTQPQPLSVNEIQQRILDTDTLLLEYSFGKERSYVWALTPTSLDSFELPPRAEIEKAARLVYQLITERNRQIVGETQRARVRRFAQSDAEYPEAAAELSKMVLEPVASLLGSKRLVIVSDGALQYIPFGALPAPQVEAAEKGDNSNHAWSGRAPLIVIHEILALPSASVLGALRQETVGRKEPPKIISVLADPVFDRNDPRVRGVRPLAAGPTEGAAVTSTGEAKQTASLDQERIRRSAAEVRARGGRPNFPRLIFTRREANAIMEVIPAGKGVEDLDFKATRKTAMNSELSQYRIVHFATHGLLDSEHPELSGLVLSLVDERGQPQNGFLNLQDIYNLNLPVDMVVLSACETALGKEIKGEGLMGLSRGFMYAGAVRVVASLWKVDDVATSELMKRFYAAMLKDNKRPAAALREAQIEIWQEKRWVSPYYWAPFIMQGEWK
jgi:CHAT domain-containing protein